MKENSAARPVSSRSCPFLSPHASNHLLRSLDVADFEALYVHLELDELTKGTVLARPIDVSMHVHPPHSGVISQVVSFSVEQKVEVAMIGRLPCVASGRSTVGALAAAGERPLPRHDWPLTQEYMARTIGVKRNTNSNAAHNFAGSRHQQL